MGGAVGFDWYDSIREFVLDMTVGTQSKQTYYPSKRDQGLVIDTRVAQGFEEKPQSNPYMCLLTGTPEAQYEDVVVDVHLNCWGFYRVLMVRRNCLVQSIGSYEKRINQMRKEYKDPVLKMKSLKVQPADQVTSHMEVVVLDSAEDGT